MKHLYLFIILFSLFSCREKPKPALSPSAPAPGRSLLLAQAPPVEGTPLPIDAIFEPARLQIGDDLLYVSCFKGDTLIYTFSLPDCKLLNRFGRRGQGPDDLMFPTFPYAKKDTVSVWGYPDMKKIKTFRVDKTGAWHPIGEQYLPENQAYNQLVKANDSLAYYNAYPPSLTLKKINLHTCSYEKEHTFEMDKETGKAFFAKNKGDLALSGRHLAYLYYYADRIDFLDPDFRLQTTYRGPRSQSAIEERDMRESIVYYLASFAGEKYLYAVNHGRPLKYRTPESCTLEIFDWNGRLKKTVQLSPGVDLFAVDEKNNQVYGYNYSRPDHFYRYPLSLGPDQ